MTPTDHAICEKLRIKRNDNLPFTGWAGTREEIAQLWGELGYKKGAIIGVWEGAFAEVICQNNANVELLCIDPYASFGGHTQSKMDRLLTQATERLKQYNATFIRKDSLEAVFDIADRSLDFVYINGKHEFNPAIMDIIHWAPKVRVEGIVSGHGFFHHYHGGMVYAVEAYTRGNNIVPWYLAHRDRDRQHSWLWVSR